MYPEDWLIMNRSYVISAQSPKVKYSAAYSKGRELMLEPLYGCAEEALLRRGASPYGEPEGPSRGRARALFILPQATKKSSLRTLGTRFARRVRFPMGREPPQGADTRLCASALKISTCFYMFYTANTP